MAKTTGLGDAFYIGGFDIGGDTNSLSKISGGPAALDVTDITQSAYSRLGGLRDGGVDFVVYHDPAAGAEHAALSTLPTADVIATYFRGTAVGNPAASMVSKQVNYDPTRSNAGDLSFAVSCMSNADGLEWGLQLTPGKRTDTSATAGAFYDNGASFAFGAQAYLQVFAFAGTDVTVAVQHATTSGGSYSNLIAFSQVTSAPQAQRVTVSNVTTVNEFLKVTTTTSGGFTSVTFAVQIVVNVLAGVVF